MDAFALKYEEKRVKTIVKGLIPVSAPKAHSNSGYVAWKTHTKDFMDLVTHFCHITFDGLLLRLATLYYIQS